MAKIPGIAFVLIGILFTAMSYYINNLQDTNSLNAFIYVGYLFIAYGIAKILIAYITKKGKSDELFNQKKGSQLPDEESLNEVVERKKHHKVDLYGYIGYCRKCKTPMRGINRYCHRCGLRQDTP